MMDSLTASVASFILATENHRALSLAEMSRMVSAHLVSLCLVGMLKLMMSSRNVNG